MTTKHHHASGKPDLLYRKLGTCGKKIFSPVQATADNKEEHLQVFNQTLPEGRKAGSNVVENNLSIPDKHKIITNKECIMPKNMGVVDRIIRIGLAVVVAILIILKILNGVPAIILGILAGVLLVTSVIGFCPLYLPFKISTKGKKESK